MSQAKIMSSVTETVRFLKERLKNEIVENSSPESLNLEQRQVEKLLFIVESSIDESYNRSMGEIMNAVDNSLTSKKTLRKQ